ncbi:complement C3-like [Polypterus senegalus]|uniref:complement C3-like n=1 Tax=Polypterus senegalus TaxID=55291 RepID=UPI0019628A2A|nr:complement C3-like [Polypterus senegalus]
MPAPAPHFSLLLVLSILHFCAAQPLFVLIAPNVLRADREETVVLEAHDFNGDINANIQVLKFPSKERLYPTNNENNMVQLTAQNDYRNTLQIKFSASNFKQDARLNSFVYLVATANQFNLEKVVLVSFHSGYVFVQTDKTIYTPNEHVMYRLFPLTHELGPSEESISVEILTPDDIVVKKEVIKASSGIHPGSFKIPELVHFGAWKVVAKYESEEWVNFTAQFEVKEYVLPSFEVTLVPARKFFYVKDTSLEVTVTARFLYGEPVKGLAYVVFGVLVNDKKVSLTDSLQIVEISEGEGKATLTSAMIKKYSSDINQLVDQTIYISASVLTASGSDMVEAELEGIKIVTSPYKILFTRTPKFFKPGMPFDVMVLVTNPDGSPANGVDVETVDGKVTAKTGIEGTARMSLNTVQDGNNLRISLRTRVPGLNPEQQAKSTMEAQPYTTQRGSRNYLHIDIQATELNPGTNLKINLHIQTNDQATQEQIKYFSYMIMNKGSLVRAGRQVRQRGQSLVTLSLLVDTQLVPSFRFVAYYFVTTGGQKEIVTDSIWVDVKDTCMGTLQITSNKRAFEPSRKFDFSITADPGAKVGLVAVDKAVFVLNSKNKLTQKKIWDFIEKNDIGCTPGSGRDNMGVFADAGLLFHSSVDIGTPLRRELYCPEPPKRRRRSLTLAVEKQSLASKYKDPQVRVCCIDGMVEISMDFNCKKRSTYITKGKECMEAFLYCCTEIDKKRQESTGTELFLARSEEEDDILMGEITSRSIFPESWLWKVVPIPEKPTDDAGLVTHKISDTLKDSITTWEILAISISPRKEGRPPLGICVAQPFEITVSKKFFIDLRLPYSVVRNEQVEVKAVIYNYDDSEMNVRVDWQETEHICSLATRKKYFTQTVQVREKSSVAVTFTLIPLKAGDRTIEVKALGKSADLSTIVADGVKKRLRVVPEGVQKRETIKSVVLEPSKVAGGVQKETIGKMMLKDMVPESEAHTYISVKGELVGETIETILGSGNLTDFIKLPTGCGEQNLGKLASVVMATLYLDKSNQWLQFGMERRAVAINYIQQGYTRQLTYRSAGGYAVYPNQQPSTWLTARVPKVYSQAGTLVHIDQQTLCDPINWLIINKQRADGSFTESAPIFVRNDGGSSSEADMQLTAFVLINLAETATVCRGYIQDLDQRIERAASFLDRHYLGLKNSYTVALASYALALTGRGVQESFLMMFASPDKTHWTGTYPLEATAFAALALLKAKRYEPLRPIMKWLTEQRSYGGAYGSTQTTVAVLQALTEFLIEAPVYEDMNLDIELDVSGRSNLIRWKFIKSNSMLARSEKVQFGKEISVTAKGSGQGTVTVMTIYNALPETNATECRTFELKLLLERKPEAKRPTGASDTYLLTIDMQYLSTREATMSILDISMLTCFMPDTTDLKRLSSGVDRYIQDYELDKALSEKGSLIIYLNKVSNQSPDTIAFKIHKMCEVGYVQPAAVTIYEYNDLEKRCMKFYHPNKESGLLSRLCDKDLCRCAEENCARLIEKKTREERLDAACESGVDFVYRATVLDSVEHSPYVYNTLQVEQVIKPGTDQTPGDAPRIFLSHSSCQGSVALGRNQQYLIMGKSSDLWPVEKQQMKYVLGGGTWLERWPSGGECHSSKYKRLCDDLRFFSENIFEFGCPN